MGFKSLFFLVVSGFKAIKKMFRAGRPLKHTLQLTIKREAINSLFDGCYAGD